ncbi:MAG TPA: chemotaxis response regulator protein-glutamate methylesterase [bacterium]
MPTDSDKGIRVLIVDDSFFMRKMLTEVLADSGGAITVIDTAQNGLEAVEKNKKLKPDVITMDVEMPQMDGLSALEAIMGENPTSIIMLSSHTGKGTETTIRALEAGAFDCALKPAGKPIGDIRGIQGELIEKIKLAARCRPKSRGAKAIRLIALPSKKLDSETKSPEKTTLPPKLARFLIAVGSSTGGPRALNDFLSCFPAVLPAAVIIVQHITVGFTKALARRLDEVSPLGVAEAEDGQEIFEGRVYVAPAGRHLTIAGAKGFFQIALNDDPPRLGVRPSADIMMRSVAKAAGKETVGIVLTGMGKDGTEGLKEIRKAGGKTFAQDEESCVVYGMPKAAMEAGVVDKQMTLSQIVSHVTGLLANK